MVDKRLKREIERMLGRRLVTSGDYEALSQSIHQRQHVLLSPTTLKRIFGYLKEEVNPRHNTLEVLAHYAGYRSYDDLLNSNGASESNPILSEKISCSELQKGQRVRISWLPDRELTILYEGDCKFSVLEAKNSKINVGDTFKCYLMIQQEPLYLDEFVHNDDSPCSYVAGRINGVHYELLQMPE